MVFKLKSFIYDMRQKKVFMVVEVRTKYLGLICVVSRDFETYVISDGCF
jgi:hypothetical protein